MCALTETHGYDDLFALVDLLTEMFKKYHQPQRLWPIISEANDLLGTGFLCFSLEGETLEGQLSRQLSTTNPNLL
ncbi:unnamed protein product [Brassica rapa]|uniref:Uncharacterized protein n=1 Tax=Brassica campestris TaxID=3711 RepID=A0A8D9HV11_BRACM|nr:unnamed protein product [Brassica rapa]